MGNDDNNIEIRPKFQGLIPRLAKHELMKLEASIINEGVREPLTVATFVSEKADAAPRVLIDGHHRYEIAKKHGLLFGTRDVEFEDEDAAVLWAIDNQIGRRNVLHVLDRVVLVEKKRPILEKRARERQLTGKADGADLAGHAPQGTTTSASKKRHPTVTEQLAAELKVSRNFYDDCLLVLSKGIPALVKFVREGDLSITGAAKLLRHTPHSPVMTDEEHREWQQELVDNVKGDPDGMQAVIRKINWNARDYKRMCDRERAVEAEKKKKEEDFQAGEKQDEEQITKWREELTETPEAEVEQEAQEEEQTEVQEVEEEQEAPEVEEETVQEAPEHEEETEEEETETVTEIHRKVREEKQEVVADIVSAVVDATQGILTTRSLGMSSEGQEVLAEVIEAWVIEHVTKYHMVYHTATGELAS